MKYKYSIIIPHKNVPKLLSRCLDTIPERDDLEVIIVDDCSSPEIVDFDNFPGKTRKNTICIFDKSCKGAGRARNIGISKSQSEWLLFADADDYFTDNLATLLDKYVSNIETEIVYLNSQIVHENEDSIEPIRFQKLIRNYTNKRFYSEKALRYSMYTPWSRMVRRNLVDKYDIQYEEVLTGNDAMFCLNCSKYAKKIAVFEPIVYNYFQPLEGSLCTNNRTKITNIEPRYLLGTRINALYDSVDYRIKESLLEGYLLTKDEASKNEYRRVFKKYSFNYITAIFRLLVDRIARKLDII